MIRRTRAWSALGVATLSLATAFVVAAEPEPAGIAWRTELKTAHQQAVAARKPILIVFSAEWCGYCRKLERTTFVDRKLVALVNEHYVPLHLDFDKQRKIADALEVRSLPCSVLLSPEADLLGRVEGYVEAEPFTETLQSGRRLMSAIDATVSTGDK